MRFPLVLLAALVLTGCSARSDDLFAYTKKPLYTGGFDLARIADGTQTDQFRVTDGSIGQLRAQVWINETAGSATITIRDPGGRIRLVTSEDADERFGLELGEWLVEATGRSGATGQAHVLVTRG